MADRLEHIEALLAAATPGPWRSAGYDDYPGDQGWYVHNGGEGMAEYGVAVALPLNPRAEADHALIVAARNVLPDLLAVVRAARDAHDAGEIIVTDADTAHEEAHLAIPEYAALALRAALVNFQGDACPECNDTGTIRLGDEISEDTGEQLGEDVACLRCDADGGRP